MTRPSTWTPRPRPWWRGRRARFFSSPFHTGIPTGTPISLFIPARPTRISWLPSAWRKAIRVTATPWSRCSSCSIFGMLTRMNAPILSAWCRRARLPLPGPASPNLRPAWRPQVCSGTTCSRARSGSQPPLAPRQCLPQPGSRTHSEIQPSCPPFCKAPESLIYSSGAGRTAVTPITRIASPCHPLFTGKARCPPLLADRPAACWPHTFLIPPPGRRC